MERRRLPAMPRDDRDPIVEQHFYVAMRYLAGVVWLVGAEREALLALRTLVDRRIAEAGEDPAELDAELRAGPGAELDAELRAGPGAEPGAGPGREAAPAGS